jgi:sugar phosphate isomerase/epimerase
VHLPLGKGQLDLTRVLAFIAANGYDGPVIVEERGGGHTAEAFVEHARLFRDAMDVTLAA